MKPYGATAVAFAEALVHGDWDAAHALCALTLRKQLGPGAIRDQFAAMFRDYGEGRPTAVHFDEQFALDEWPLKEPGDVGRAYVSILGDNFVEAVTVTVTQHEGALLIRDIEWGRP